MGQDHTGHWQAVITQVMRNKLAPGICLTVLLAPPVHSDGSDPLVDQADYLSEIPIVSSATRLNQKITDVPAAITIIDREMITASGATEIPQLLRLVPGYLSYYVLGNQFGVTNRGITYEFPGDLEVMLDGRSVYEPIFSAVEWSSLGITVNDIQYIEVLRGSNTPAYGSNAFLGAINIVTTNPVQAKGTYLSTTFGEIGTRNAQINQRGQVAGVNYSLGVSYRANDGFPRLEKQPNPSAFDRIKDSNEALHLSLQLLYTPTLYDTIEFHAGVGKSDIDIPGDDITDSPKGFSPRNFNNNYQMIRWVHNTQDNNEIKLQFYHNRLKIDERRDLGPLSSLLGVSPATIALIFPGQTDERIVTGLKGAISERFDLEGQHTLNLSEAHRVVWGVGIRHDRIRSNFLLGQDAPIDETQYRLFGNWEWRFHRQWTANLGAMAERNSIIGEFISPRAAINFQVLPGHTVHAAYTYGNRTPSILEANQYQGATFSDGTIIALDVNVADRLDKSVVREQELGYLGHFFNNKVSIDLRLFHTETDKVVGEYSAAYPDLDGRVSTMSNNMQWHTKGLDTQIQFRPDSTTLFSLQYAYTDFNGERIKYIYPVVTRNLHRELPRHNASLLGSKSFADDWSASFVWYYLSEVAWRQGDLIRSHDRLDMRIAKEFIFGTTQGKAELIGHNLLGSYEEFEDFNLFETRVLVRLSLQF